MQARYSHVTADMRRRLMSDLTDLWESALEARWRMSPRSPVETLDQVLREAAERLGWPRPREIISRDSPEEII